MWGKIDMQIEQLINNFYDSIARANESLHTSEVLIESRQEKILEIMNNLRQQVTIQPSAQKEMSPIKKVCLDEVDTYKDTVEKWIEAANHYIKGKQFVNQFEKSVLLMVFGEVKAGKSALGNFISGHSFRETSYEHLDTAPTFYRYDSSAKNGEAIKKEVLVAGCFVEDVVEQTNTIQYFTLKDGLTWVDTPGIHSLSTANQALANDYIKYADLILFLTPANNPSKQDEIREIEKLIDGDKPFLVTITKSDEESLQVVNGEMVKVLQAKSRENRRAQENYLAQTINQVAGEGMLSKNKYISLSTRLGKKALDEKDAALFEASNLPAFYEQIGEVISERALELKMKRPKDELNLVIKELIYGEESKGLCGILEMKQNIMQRLEDIDEKKAVLDEAKEGIIEKVKENLMTDVYELMYKSKKNQDAADKKHVADQIITITEDCVLRGMMEKVSEILSDFKHYTIKTKQIETSINYEEESETVEYAVYEMKTIERKPQGIKEHLGHYLFKKTYTESKMESRIVSKQNVIGDNYNEVFAKMWTTLEQQVQEMINIEMHYVKEEYFSEMQNLLISILGALDDVSGQLGVLQF